MLRDRTALMGTFAGTMLLVLSAQSLVAQEKKAAGLPPIEVVATRIPEAPNEVPASIEVISGADLTARGARTLREALSLATGVAIAPGGDGGAASSVPEFWGLREFDAFLLVVDNVPWGGALNPALSTLALRDVERIEILRGPAPVTYGATSFVGVIHVVHKPASLNNRYLSAFGGSFGSAGGAVDLSVLNKGSWKSRLSADYDKEGFKDDRTGFSRAHALWRFSNGDGPSRTWFTADVNMVRQDPASPHPREGAALTTATPLDANHNPKDAYLNEDRFALSAGIDRKAFGDATWSTMASFTHSTNHMFRGFLTEISNDPNNASGFKENIDLNDVYADTHILWPSKSTVRLMTGADLLFAQGEAKGATFTYTAPLNGSTATAVTEPTTLDKDAENQRIFLGAYASAEWRPTSRFSLTGGVRLNSTSERHDEGSETSTNTKVSGGVGAMFGVYEKGANYARLFANYRSTFKPAAFDFGLAEVEEILKPETSTSYEGGIKVGTMDGRLSLEGSYFNMDFKNIVIATIVNNLPELTNGGQTKFKGFEVGADLQLQSDVHARATYSFHDGKFGDYQMDFGGTLTDLKGKRFEMSARQLWSAGLTYSPEKGAFLYGTANYTGDRYLNKRNTAKVPGFATFDAGAGYRFDRYEVRVDGRNLGDKRDAVSESEFGDAQYYRMTARTIQAGVVVKF